MNRKFAICVLFCLWWWGTSQLQAQVTIKQAKGKGAESSKKFVENEREDINARQEHEKLILGDPLNGGIIPKDIRQKELIFTNVGQSALKSKKNFANANRNGSDEWSNRGPSNVGGRTRALAIDRTNENVFIAGGVTGGMWRSDDAGKSWVKTTLPSQFFNATCVTQDPRPGFSNVWYYGTGEMGGFIGAGLGGVQSNTIYSGNGIYKSVDGGNTWSVLSATTSDPTIFGGGSTFGNVGQPAVGGDFSFVWNLAINPTNGDLYAATYTGIMRSTDGGASWTKVLAGFNGRPNAPSITDIGINIRGVVYATVSPLSASGSLNRGIYTTTNGTDWTNRTDKALSAFTTPPTNYTRIVIDISLSNPNRVFFFLDMRGGTGNRFDFGLLRYDATSDNWQNLSANLPIYQRSNSGNMGQNIYNQLVRIKPDDPNFVVIGTINLNRSFDGFATPINEATDPQRLSWIGGYDRASDSFLSYPNHHPDNHNLIFFPSNPKKAISSHDGGISITEDITAPVVEWKDVSNGYFTTQAYAVAIDEETPGDMRVTAGFQDNGNWTSYGTATSDQWYEEAGGGDGFRCAIAPGSSTRYISTQFGRIIKLTNQDVLRPQGGIITEGAQGNLFDNPFILNPSNPNTMYQAFKRALRYNQDLANTTASLSPNWINLSKTLDENSFVSAIAASKDVPDIVYYGRSSGQVFRLDNAPTNPDPVNITSVDFPPGAYVNSIAVDETDYRKIIVVFSNYGIRSVWRSIDAGATWTDIGGNLEQNPNGSGNGPSIRWAEIINYPSGTNGYFLGTSTGLYYTENLNGANTQWVQQAPEIIGNSIVTMVKARNSDGLVAIATFGSGLFSTFYGQEDLPPVASKEIPDVNAYKNDAPYQLNLNNYFADPDDNNAEITLSIANNTTSSVVTPTLVGNDLTLTFSNTGVSFITVRATSNGKSVDEIFRVEVQDFDRRFLFEQSKNRTENGAIIGKYTNNASYFIADDFTVPEGEEWNINTIKLVTFATDQVISLGGQRQLKSLTVYFYKDNNGLPGEVASTQNLPTQNFKGLPFLNAGLFNSTIEFDNPTTLTGGKYWMRIAPEFEVPTTEYSLVITLTAGTGNAVGASPETDPPGSFGRDLVFDLVGTSTGAPNSQSPSELTARAISDRQIQVVWKDNSDWEVGFAIERSLQPGTGYNTVGQVGKNVTIWTDNTGLQKGTTYYYRVRALSVSAPALNTSNEASAIIEDLPSPPANLILKDIKDGKNVFQWQDNSQNEEGFELARSFISSKSYGPVARVTSNQNTIEIKNDSTDNEDFFYVVRSLSSQGNSPNSNEVVVLANPTDLKITTIDKSSSKLTWSDVSRNETGYKVERSLLPTEGFQEIASINANEAAFTDNNLTQGQDYYYRVKAVAANGFSPYSKVAKLDWITSIETTLLKSEIKVYPNPAKEYFTVEVKKSDNLLIKTELITLQGQVLDRQFMQVTPQKTLKAYFKASYLPVGTYIIKIYDGSRIETRQVVVN